MNPDAANRIIAARMPEDKGSDSLEAHLRALLKIHGLWGFHPRSSIGSERGWPDWVLIGPRRLIYRELKSEHGPVSAEQRAVGRMLRAAGQDWGIWRPSDLLAGRIERELADLAAVQGELFG